MESNLELRDYFAGKALEGIMSDVSTPRAMVQDMSYSTHDKQNDTIHDYISQECYRLADAMIKERSRTLQTNEQ